MPNESKETLVNQKPGDDIPFGEGESKTEPKGSGGGEANVPQTTQEEIIANLRRGNSELASEIDDLQNQLSSANRTNAELLSQLHKLKTAAPGTQSKESLTRIVLYQFLQGMAANGNFNRSLLQNDAAADATIQHAIGLAKRTVAAMQQAKL